MSLIDYAQQLIYDNIQFIKDITKDFDESHDADHAVCVASNSLYIYLEEVKEPNIKDINIIILIALFHDVRDSKYLNYGINIISEQDLFERIQLNLYNNFEHNTCYITQQILNCIELISFTKEKKNRLSGLPPFNLAEPFLFFRHIVSDADKLESLGEEGVMRGITYSLFDMYNKNIDKYDGFNSMREHLINFAKNRIILLNSDNYIKTKTVKLFAEQLINKILDNIDNM